MKTAPETRRPDREAVVARLHELVDHLPRFQVAPPGHPGRRAELAAHDAANLRRQADACRASLVKRDQHRLDGQPVMSPEPQLLKAIRGRNHRRLQFESGQTAEQLEQAFGNLIVPAPDGRVVNTSGKDRRQQSSGWFQAVPRAPGPGSRKRPERSCEGRSRRGRSRKIGKKTLNVTRSFIRVRNET